MSEWRGLHNPERHYSYTGIHSGAKIHTCRRCATTCLPDMVCRCCLAAEVEELQRIRVSQIEDIIALRYDLEVAREAQATITALRAQVQRVRELHAPYAAESGYVLCLGCGRMHHLCPTIRALDGGGE